jgi:purine nucleosidase
MILDVDTGVDDALALAVAARHADIRLEAVVTVAGNVGLELTTRNTLRVLEWLGVSDVPVAAGANAPLAPVVRKADHWHGKDGLGGAQLPAAKGRALDDGVGFLIERLLAAPGELTLVCTGPLTNLALAVQRQPDVVGAAREVVLMGGAARPPGNVTPVAEFNIYADPQAAAIVFRQSWPLTMVGLDVTNRVQLTRADRDALSGQSSAEAVLVREVTGHHFDGMRIDAIALHDPLAVLVALAPGLVSMVETEVVVETEGEHTEGQTVVDLRTRRLAELAGSNKRVCLEVDSDRARQMFFDSLGLRLLFQQASYFGQDDLVVGQARTLAVVLWVNDGDTPTPQSGGRHRGLRMAEQRLVDRRRHDHWGAASDGFGHHGQRQIVGDARGEFVQRVERARRDEHQAERRPRQNRRVEIRLDDQVAVHE